MVSTRLLPKTFVALCTLFVVVCHGFQFRKSSVPRVQQYHSSTHHYRHHGPSHPTQRLTTAIPTTTTDVDADPTKLTDHDEEILFGDDTDGVKSKLRSSDHRKKDMFGNILPQERRSVANPLDHSTTNPLINKLHTIRQTIQSCPELWYELSQACPTLRAVYDEHMSDRIIDETFEEFYQSIQHSASVFQKQLGIKKGQHISIFAENSATWLMMDQSLQSLGAVTAVRGADAPLEELRYIYSHSDSANCAILQGPKLLQKLIQTPTTDNTSPLGFYNTKYGPVKTIILMNREKKTNDEIAALAQQAGVQVFVFHDLIQSSPTKTSTTTTSPVTAVSLNDVATIVYTSGTTGNPKGVMLTHGNLLHQIGHRLAPTKPYETSEPLPGETLVSILPVWHITERTFELWMAARGCHIVYSSIPYFKKDLAKHKPQWMVLVPRVLEKIATGVQDKFSSGSVAVQVLSKFFTKVGQAYMKYLKIVRGLVVTPLGESSTSSPVNGMDEIIARIMTFVLRPWHMVGTKLVWSKVQEGFGGRVKVIISGGSALAGSLETFYETAGLNICVGYGLTECSPLISFRRSDANLITAGCAGTACTDTEFRIVDPSIPPSNDKPRPSLPIGEVGLIIAKGPQVMKGYYKNKEATDKAIDSFGWFDTGDLGRVNPATGDLLLTGRAKDTIVLSNGENIEPVPIEDAIMGASPYIDQVMLTGQDGRSLIAITVLNPMELLNGGFIDAVQAEKLQKAIEIVSDPKCTTEDCTSNCQILVNASIELRRNKALQNVLDDVVKSATNTFRKWEKVNDCYITLEPFAMSNGQLTQSYKVKRNQVVERYTKELP